MRTHSWHRFLRSANKEAQNTYKKWLKRIRQEARDYLLDSGFKQPTRRATVEDLCRSLWGTTDNEHYDVMSTAIEYLRKKGVLLYYKDRPTHLIFKVDKLNREMTDRKFQEMVAQTAGGNQSTKLIEPHVEGGQEIRKRVEQAVVARRRVLEEVPLVV